MSASIPKPGAKELFSLLESVSLTEYYQRFISVGGDDLRQLAEADDAEFGEIAEMVTMSNKPLHCRRLRKALQTWQVEHSQHFAAEVKSSLGASSATTVNGSGGPSGTSNTSPNEFYPVEFCSSGRKTAGNTDHGVEDRGVADRKRSSSFDNSTPSKSRRRSDGEGEVCASPFAGSYYVNLQLPEEVLQLLDPCKLELRHVEDIRTYSKIFGRDDRKRKNSRLQPFEEHVNEASFQLCLRDPLLLLKRNERLDLSRRVVRDNMLYFQSLSPSSNRKKTDTPTMDEEGMETNFDVGLDGDDGDLEVEALSDSQYGPVSMVSRLCSSVGGSEQKLSESETYQAIHLYISCSMFPPQIPRKRKNYLRRRAHLFTLVDKKLYFIGKRKSEKREWIAEDQEQHNMIDRFHINEHGLHKNFSDTLRDVSTNYYWISMRADIDLYLRNCPSCRSGIAGVSSAATMAVGPDGSHAHGVPYMVCPLINPLDSDHERKPVILDDLEGYSGAS